MLKAQKTMEKWTEAFRKQTLEEALKLKQSKVNRKGKNGFGLMNGKKRILEKLKKDGYIDNFWCIDNKVSTRLSSTIHLLRKQGMKFDDAKCKYLPGTKNFRYYLLEPVQKYKWVDYEVNGERLSKRVLLSGGEKDDRQGGEDPRVERT